MFNFFSNNKSIIDAKTLQELLDEILTPKLEQLGLTKATNYSWHEQNMKDIRHGFTYNQLKAAAGTFTWGVNLNFLPIIQGDRIEYQRTVKKYMHHLFEWTNEYSNSFIGGRLKNGVTTHFGFNEAKKSIANLFDKYEKTITEWFDTTKTVENLIDIAERQVSIGKYYDIHYPRPNYVLAFLYAKANQIDKAVKLFDTVDNTEFGNKEDLRIKVKSKSLDLTV